MRLLGTVLLVISALTAWGSSVLAAQNISATNQAHQISVGDSVKAPPVACACFSTSPELQLLYDWTRHFRAALKVQQLAHRVMKSVTD